jgi:hypothetical protein
LRNLLAAPAVRDGFQRAVTAEQRAGVEQIRVIRCVRDLGWIIDA